MLSLSVESQIDAPIERVFELASDFAGAPERISGIVRMEMLTDGPVGVGTRFRETRVMFKREATEEMEVLEFDAPRRYVLGAESCGCRYRSEFTFTPQDGGTKVTMTFEGTPLTRMAKIMGFLMRPMAKVAAKEVCRDLADLKAAAEGASAAT